MAKQKDVAGIGRIYNGDVFLGEVLYKLNITNGKVPGIKQVSGRMLSLQPTLRFQKGDRNMLRLEDGQMYDIAIHFSDEMTGKYLISGAWARQQV